MEDNIPNKWQPKMVTRDKEGHYIMINGSIHLKDTRVMNIYTPYLKGEMDNTVIAGGFNTPLSTMDRT